MLKRRDFDKTRIIFIIIACIHFIITFFTDKLYFTSILEDSSHMLSFVLCKILLFIVLNLFWQFIYQISLGKNDKMRSIFKYAMIYFLPMMVILTIIWPGPIADGDISFFMNREKVYSYNYYLHYLTSLIHIIGLMIFPFLTGIVIFQSFCYSLIVGYIINRAHDFFESQFIYLIYLVFFIPSFAYFSLYVNRTPIYGFLYILFLGILIFDYLEKKKLTPSKLLSLILLGAILVVFRYEGIYLIITCPLLILKAYGIKFNIKRILLLVIAIIIAMNIISIPQKRWEKLYQGNYTYRRLQPAFVHSLSNMLQYDDIEGDFEIIDKVMSVDIMKEYGDISNITPYNYGVEREDYSDQEDEAFIKESIRIFYKNPAVYLKVRFRTLHASALHSKDSLQNFEGFKNSHSHKSLFTDELFPGPRNKALKILVNNPEEGDMSFQSERARRLGNIKNLIFYNLYIALAIGVLIIIFSIIKRDLFWFIVTFGLVIHGGVIFILAPAAYFAYYLPISMAGSLLGVLFILGFITKKSLRRLDSLE